MTDKNKLELIGKIIEKAWDFPGGDSVSWAGFLESTLTAIQVITAFVSEEEQSDE